MKKDSNYHIAKKNLFDNYIDFIFDSCHDVKKITSEYKNYARYFKKNYLHLLPQNKEVRILEIGCGMGHFQYFLRQNGYKNSIGIDISSQEIDFCKKNGFNVFKEDALNYLQKNRRKFDVIVIDDTLPYFDKDGVINVLTGIKDKLKEGGLCFIKTLNISNPITGPNSLARDFAAEVNFTEESLREICLAVGFSKVTIRPLNIYVYYYNPLNYIAWALEYCMSKFFRILFLFYGRKTTKIFSKDILAICRK